MPLQHMQMEPPVNMLLKNLMNSGAQECRLEAKLLVTHQNTDVLKRMEMLSQTLIIELCEHS